MWWMLSLAPWIKTEDVILNWTDTTSIKNGNPSLSHAWACAISSLMTSSCLSARRRTWHLILIQLEREALLSWLRMTPWRSEAPFPPPSGNVGIILAKVGNFHLLGTQMFLSASFCMSSLHFYHGRVFERDSNPAQLRVGLKAPVWMKVIQGCFNFNQQRHSAGRVFEVALIIFETESHSLAQDS